MENNIFKGVKLFIPKPKMTDPPRYPKLTDPIEGEVKKDFKIAMDKILVDVTKKMIGFN